MVRGDDELTADARRFGISESEIADLHASLSNVVAGFSGVWPQHAEIVTAYLVSATQWRTRLEISQEGMRTRFTGLDYAGVKVALEACELPVTPELWAGLMIMEHTARDALNGDLPPQ